MKQALLALGHKLQKLADAQHDPELSQALEEASEAVMRCYRLWP